MEVLAVRPQANTFGLTPMSVGPSRRGRIHAKMVCLVGIVKKGMRRKGHQQRVNQKIKSAEGSAGLLHKLTKPTAW